MALTRRDFLIAVPLVTGAIMACSDKHSGAARSAYSEIRATGDSNPNAKTILVFMPQTEQTNDVWSGLSDELPRNIRAVAVRVESAADVPIIEEAMTRHKPAGVVLMNNPTVAAYREFQRLHVGNRFPPAVIVMTSFLENPSSQAANATGISYEIPLLMLMSDLRKVLALSAERVGVVVRPSLLRFITQQIELARREQILVSVERVSSSPRPAEIKLALRRLKQRVDVIWVLNDDQLLTPRLITKGWLPGLDERPRVPTIVGVASLVSPQHSFGTFAVLPDHVALGMQAAGLLLDIAAANWSLDHWYAVQLPRSTTTAIDLAQIRERFTLKQHALEQVDKILE